MGIDEAHQLVHEDLCERLFATGRGELPQFARHLDNAGRFFPR
jgi:hypothetical protein